MSIKCSLNSIYIHVSCAYKIHTCTDPSYDVPYHICASIQFCSINSSLTSVNSCCITEVTLTVEFASECKIVSFMIKLVYGYIAFGCLWSAYKGPKTTCKIVMNKEASICTDTVLVCSRFSSYNNTVRVENTYLLPFHFRPFRQLRTTHISANAILWRIPLHQLYMYGPRSISSPGRFFGKIPPSFDAISDYSSYRENVSFWTNLTSLVKEN